jgi:hypothetical protein
MVMLVLDILCNLSIYLPRNSLNNLDVSLRSKNVGFNLDKRFIYSLKCKSEGFYVSDDVSNYEEYYERLTFNRCANMYTRDGKCIMREVSSMCSLDERLVIFAVKNQIYSFKGDESRPPKLIYHHDRRILMIFSQGFYTYVIDDSHTLYCFKYTCKQFVYMTNLTDDSIRLRKVAFEQGRIYNIRIESSYTVINDKVYLKDGSYYMQ